MGKFIVLILDGFGVGAMEDVREVRPVDIGANTAWHLFERLPGLRLPNLERLGLMNAIGKETACMRFSDAATWGKSKLMHIGADTFLGHQEIMGTLPVPPVSEPFGKRLDEVKDLLVSNGFSVTVRSGKKNRFLVVEDAVVVGDNMECDPGQIVNVTSALDSIPFERVLSIGRFVRSVTKVSRVITSGGRKITIEKLISAVEEREDIYMGLNAPKSGVTNHDFIVVHMGYGADAYVQAPTCVGEAGIPVYLIGKVADIVENRFGRSFPMVSTEKVMGKVYELSKCKGDAFICANVQETDLAGHEQDAEKYAGRLIAADEGLSRILPELDETDILLVMADHGNDPAIGHSKHTRELVPLLVYGKNIKKGMLGSRETLSDAGTTVCDYFKSRLPQNGASFLQLLL